MKFHKYIIVILLLYQHVVFAEETIHIVNKGSTSFEALSTLKLQQRLTATASEYKKYGSVARVAHFDMAYPKDVSEYQRMNGFGILWITAHSQAQQELPIKNVRLVRKGKSDIQLVPSYSFSSKEKSSNVSKVLGKYRHDSIYKIPFHDGVQGALLVTDYAVNRKDFVLGNLPDSFPEELGRLSTTSDNPKRPTNKIFKVMLFREYPAASQIIN